MNYRFYHLHSLLGWAFMTNFTLKTSRMLWESLNLFLFAQCDSANLLQNPFKNCTLKCEWLGFFSFITSSGNYEQFSDMVCSYLYKIFNKGDKYPSVNTTSEPL